MEFTKEQLAIINSENPKTLLQLEGIEVLAIYSLGQMHNKIVRMQTVFGTSNVGLFKIESINGNPDLDFSDPEPWRNVVIDDMFVSLVSPNEFGSIDKRTFNNLFDIKSMELLGK